MAEETFLHESARQVVKSIEARCGSPAEAKAAAKQFVGIFSTMAGLSSGEAKEPAKPEHKKAK